MHPLSAGQDQSKLWLQKRLGRREGNCIGVDTCPAFAMDELFLRRHVVKSEFALGSGGGGV